MNKDILYEILNSKSEKLTAVEIEGLLNEELEKDPNEMDTDLVDLCIDALDEIRQKQQNLKKKRIRFSKLLAVAIIMILIIAVSIPVGAKYLNMDVPQGVVSFYDEYFSINLNKTLTFDELKDELTNYNVDNIILPKDITTDDTVFYKPVTTKNPLFDELKFKYQNNNLIGYITLYVYQSQKTAHEDDKVPTDFNNVKYVKNRDVEILVFDNGNNSYLYYQKEKIMYNIVVDCTFEHACNIAKTL